MIERYLKQFRKITSTEEGVTRLAFSEWEEEAREAAVAAFSRHKKIRTVRDAAGNLFIVNGMSKGPYVVMGSHLDTVPEGGWLDGALGVAGAIAAMQRVLREHREAPVAVAIWADEEGYRFGNGLFGSRAYADRVRDEELSLRDREGVLLAELLAELGLQKKPRVDKESGELKISFKYKRPLEIATYAEAHIEQGRNLIDAGARIGVVTSVAGVRRWRLEAAGERNHAGTTPMRLRRDALVPIAGMVGRLPQLVRGLEEAVVTCGDLRVEPGVSNIIPDRAWAIVEQRAPSERDQDEVARRLKELVASTGPRAPGVGLDTVSLTARAPVDFATEAIERFEAICEELGVGSIRMVSMAGHDAGSIARVAPAGLFFIPSIRGVSHRPDEDSKKDDIKLAEEILYMWALAEVERVL